MSFIVPARVDPDDGQLWAGCSSCRSLHPVGPDNAAPVCPHRRGLLRRLDALLVIVDDVVSDSELLTLADELHLTFHGWSLDADQQSWTHFIGAGYDLPSAMRAQGVLDGFAARQLRRLEAEC